MCPRPALRAIVFFSLFITSFALAAELKIRVVDPHNARVVGARVTVTRASDHVVMSVRVSDARGEASADALADGNYALEVLAPGFAVNTKSVAIPNESAVEVKLSVLAASETVVVSATRTPMPADESGSIVETLDHDQIETLQPIAAGEALRFVPGTVVADNGSRGGITSLFVRGGDSRYNKVLVDGVPVNESGGTFNFGVVPLYEADRLELARGPQSTLYGSDAMTSLVQFWSRTGRTLTPELTFGADGGNFGTAHGYASLAGAWRRFDYNFFADHFSTDGQDVNNSYFNTLEGGNVGLQLSSRAALRFRTRHFNSRVGTPGFWDYPGIAELPKDTDARARQNNLLANLELSLNLPSRWQHRFQVYDYNTRRLNLDDQSERGCDPVSFVFTDCFFSDYANQNRLGFQYQGDYQPRAWAHSTFGYEFEDENGFFHTRFPTLDPTFPFVVPGGSDLHGLRRNHAVYGQQIIAWKRLTIVGGARYVHNESFGDRVVPRVALSYVLWHGHGALPRTRLRGAYAEGIKEPRFEESFGISGTFPENPNPNLKPERSRSFEAGFIQTYAEGKYSLTGTYFNNLFRQQIVFNTFLVGPFQTESEFFNLGRSIAHGAEVEIHARIRPQLSLDGGYTYTSTQITKALPFCVGGAFTGCNIFPEFTQGKPLLRRPRHSGNVLLSYISKRWGTTLGGTFTGRRADSDFLALAPLGLTADHTDAYARWDAGAWYQVERHVRLYVDGENIFDRSYQDALGFKGQLATIRAGVRFKFGGE